MKKTRHLLFSAALAAVLTGLLPAAAHAAALMPSYVGTGPGTIVQALLALWR